MWGSRFKTAFLAVAVTVMSSSLVIFPKESFEASLRGLNMWWEIVFPSLLPFFIISEMLIGFGIVKFIGVLLEPLMRPLFRVPGVGGFVMAMGMASGFPSGAKITARLRQENQLSRIEAERLVSFTNSSNPLFIFGAVSVGFFKNADLGIILALSHYLGNVVVGLIMRFYGKNGSEKIEKERSKSRFPIRTALVALHRTRLNDKRPIGKLLGDAVTSSVQTLLMIGGFIILFSVLNNILFHLQITAFLAHFINYILKTVNISENLSVPLISGLFEITQGGYLTSKVSDVPLMELMIITSFILAFSGFSVQAQVASILAQTDIRFRPFFMARILHGFIASTLCILFWKLLNKPSIGTEQLPEAIPVSFFLEGSWMHNCYYFIITNGPIITISFLIIYIMILSKRIYLQK